MIGIVRAFCCQSYFCVFGECGCKRKDVLFCCNCTLVVEYGKLKVADSVCACGSQIECAVKYAKHACDVCRPAFLFGVEFFECGLLILRERANGTRKTDVARQFAEFESVITVARVLASERNAFDCDEESLFCNQILIFQILCGFEDLRVIGRGLNGFAFENFNGRACNFIRSAISSFRTGYTDKHTFFEFEINGVCFELIYIITAVSVLHINRVRACAVLLGTECGDVAFYYDSLIVGSRNVLCPSEFSPFGNDTRKLD